MKNSNQINFVIAILGLGITLGSLASVIEFPSFFIFAAGLAMVLTGIIRAIGQIEQNPAEMNARNKTKTPEKIGFAVK
jgi:hypothetical protein